MVTEGKMRVTKAVIAIFVGCLSKVNALCKSDLEPTTTCATKLGQVYTASYEDCKDRASWATTYAEIQHGQSRVLLNKYHYFAATEYFRKPNINWSPMEKKIVDLFKPKRSELKFKSDCNSIERQSRAAGVTMGKMQQLEILLEDKVTDTTPLIDFGAYSSPMLEESFGMEYQSMYLAKVTQYNLRILQTKQEVTLDKLENYAFEIHVA